MASGCAVQLGGGIRNVEAALRWLESGASLVIIGSMATELLRRWRRWPAAGLVYTDTTRDGQGP